MKGKRILLWNMIWIVLALVACSSQEAPSTQVNGTLEEKQPVQAFGLVKARVTRDISVDFPVKIEKLQVMEGQVISGGETLAVIDVEEAKHAVRLLEDRISSLKTETDEKQKVYVQKKESISKDSNPELLKMEYALKKAQKTYDDLLSENAAKVSLYHAGALTGKEFLEYENSIEAAGYACKDAELNLESMRETLHMELLQAETDINAALQDLSELEKELQNSVQKLSPSILKGNEIISDITSGVVCSVDCKPGDTVPAGGKLFSIMDASSFIIEANVDEQFIKDVKPGAKVYVIPEYDRSLEYRGKVSSISALAIQQNGETVVPVEIDLEKHNEGLNPGYNMEVSIEVE